MSECFSSFLHGRWSNVLALLLESISNLTWIESNGPTLFCQSVGIFLAPKSKVDHIHWSELQPRRHMGSQGCFNRACRKLWVIVHHVHNSSNASTVKSGEHTSLSQDSLLSSFLFKRHLLPCMPQTLVIFTLSEVLICLFCCPSGLLCLGTMSM